MDDEQDFKEYMNIVRKRRVIFLLGFLLIISLVAAYTYFSEPVYEAKSLVVLTNQDQANFLLGSSAPGMNNLETQKILIQSPQVMQPITRKYSSTDFELIVDHIRNSNIIEIIIRTTNPVNAPNIANDVAETYIAYSSESIRDDAQNNIEFISEKIKTYDEEISLLDMELRSKNVNELSRAELLEYQSLEKELVAKTTIYNHLLTKREEAILTTQLNNTNLRIVQYAEIPETPIRPNRELNMILGFILALGGGLGLSILADNTATSRRTRFKESRINRFKEDRA